MSGERKIKNFLGNFRGRSAYFRGVRDSLYSIFGKAPHSRGYNNPELFEKPTDPIGADPICFKCFILN